jgi:hypothetical protein
MNGNWGLVRRSSILAGLCIMGGLIPLENWMLWMQPASYARLALAYRVQPGVSGATWMIRALHTGHRIRRSSSFTGSDISGTTA